MATTFPAPTRKLTILHHTDAGIQYIIENCLPGDRARWVEQIKEDLEAHKRRQQLEAEQSEAASPKTFTRQPSPATELEPSSVEKVDSTQNLCHRCGTLSHLSLDKANR